jgi:hypothetical protein
MLADLVGLFVADLDEFVVEVSARSVPPAPTRSILPGSSGSEGSFTDPQRSHCGT